MQHALGGPFPFGGFRADLDQLAGEGELVGVDVKVGAQPGPQLQAAAGQIGGAGLEAAQFGVDRLGVLIDFAQVETFAR